MAEVRIVNPAPAKRRTSKKGKHMARAKRDSKGRFLPKGRGGSKPKRRRKNPGTAVATRSSNAPRRRGGGGGKAKRRRKNPEGGGVPGSPLDIGRVFKTLPAAVLSRLWLAFAQRRWGGAWGTGLMGQGAVSPFAGQGMNFRGYLVGLVATWVGAKVVQRWKPGWGYTFWRSGIENMATRLVWTELIARSQWGQQTFGAYITDDRNGNRWLQQGGQQMAMMGYGQLAPARPLDGLQPARPLDGADLVRARPLDVRHGGVGGRRMTRAIARAIRRGAPMGHYLPPGTPDMSARYHGSGAATPYHSAYQQAY